MKKFGIFSIILLMAIFSFSCKKCVTCTFKSSTQTHDYDELCGSKANIEVYEEKCQTAASTNNGTCTCQ